jgi:enoyl-CoA hydratase
MTPAILVASDGDVATVTLFNPDKLNAINAAMWRRLREVFGELSADHTLRAVIVRGEGGNFAAGGDIEEFLTERSTPEQAQRYHRDWVATALTAIAECTHPTVAAIQGNCVGGGLEIAAACDLRIAGEGARFGAPIMKLGFSMYPGELAGVVALAGAATASEILLEGRLLSAAEAAQKGLVTRVVPDDQVHQNSVAVTRHIASGAPLVARAHKRMIRQLAAQQALQGDPFWFLGTEDYAEGMAAFMEKRRPVFTGR